MIVHVIKHMLKALYIFIIYLLFFLRVNIMLMISESEYPHLTVLPI